MGILRVIDVLFDTSFTYPREPELRYILPREARSGADRLDGYRRRSEALTDKMSRIEEASEQRTLREARELRKHTTAKHNKNRKRKSHKAQEEYYG